jgi:hypothetical protein
MSLFTDNDIIDSASLAAMDSEVSAAAAATKPAIVLDGTGSICELAWQECGRKMLQAMQSYVSYPAQTGMPATHIAAVTNVGVPSRTQPRVRLNQIVATEINYAGMPSAIELWVSYHALLLLFRDASARLGKDRYEEKMQRYQDAAQRAWRGLKSEGLPMLYQPLEAPGAKHGFAAGTWGTASLTAAGGGTNPNPQNVFVAITWYDASKYVSQADKHNAESAPSEAVPFVIPADGLLRADISTLNPPNGNADPVGLSQGTWTPLNATHWNLWVGPTESALYLQQEGIPIGTKTWTLAGDPISSGTVLGRGQYPDLNLVFMNLAMRG